MAEERRSKLPKHEPGKVPDPSPTCPRCHYWQQKAAAEGAGERTLSDPWPLGIDQNKAQHLLVAAFPQKQRSRE